MLHLASSRPSSKVLMKPRRSESLRAGSGSGSGSGRSQDVLAGLAEELHDIKRVRDYGQEEDLKEALGKMIERVDELSALLSQAYKTQSELETQAKLAKSNLQMALANNEMLEDALRRESAAGSKNVGWRRRNDSQTDPAHPPTSDEGSEAASAASRRGSAASNSVQSATAPASEAAHPPSAAAATTTTTAPASSSSASSVPNSPVSKPITSPQSPPAQESTPNSRFFRFRFGSSAASAASTPATSPNPSAGASSSTSRPQTPPASAGAARRPLDVIRERDAAHLTSASLPSLVADTTKREHELEAALGAERARCERVAAEKRTLEAEVEGLSQALFEEANRMVAQERRRCAEIEEELRQVREEKEALKSAMRIVEQENTRLRGSETGAGDVPTTQAEDDTNAAPSLKAAAATAEEDEPTPRTSRPSTPRNRDGSSGQTPSPSSTPRSSISERRIDDRNSASSSMRAIHERSSTPGSGVRSPSPPLPEQLPDSADVDGHESASAPPADARVDGGDDGGEAQDVDAVSERSGESSCSTTKSSFESMPAAESPWAKI